MTTTNDTPTAAEPAYVDPFPQTARERVLAALAQAGRQPDADGSESAISASLAQTTPWAFQTPAHLPSRTCTVARPFS